MQVSSYKIISSYLVDIIFSVLSSSGSVKILEEDQEHWSIIFVDPAEWLMSLFTFVLQDDGWNKNYKVFAIVVKDSPGSRRWMKHIFCLRTGLGAYATWAES